MLIMMIRIVIEVYLVLMQRLSTEPGLKDLKVVKEVGLQEVEERPKLPHVVLEGGARQQKTVFRLKALENCRQSTFRVLDPMALVHHDEAPLDLVQDRSDADGRVIAGDENGGNPTASKLFARSRLV